MPEEPSITRLLQPDRTMEMEWGRFSYSESGGGKALLFLHGDGGSRHDYEPYVSYFPDRRVVRPDLRGHCGSDLPKDPPTIAALADDCFALAEKLWLGRFGVVGHGVGGMIALEMLGRSADRLQGIVLIDTCPVAAWAKRLGDPMQGATPDLVARIRKQHRETFVRWMPGVRDRYWQGLESFDARTVVATTPNPVLFLMGDRGRTPVDQNRLGIARRDNTQLIWVPGGHHFPHLDKVESMGRVIRKYYTGEETVGGATAAPAGPPPKPDDLWRARH